MKIHLIYLIAIILVILVVSSCSKGHLVISDAWGGVDNLTNDWFMLGREPTHNGRSPFIGPATNALKWVAEYNGSAPVIGQDGTIYLTGDKLYAFKSDGTLKWTNPHHGTFSPSIGSDGTIYITAIGSVFAVNSDGSDKWVCSFGLEAGTFYAPSIGLDGTIYVGDFFPLIANYMPSLVLVF